VAEKLDYGIHYSHWHDQSDEHAAQMRRQFLAELGVYLPENRDTSALDIGCGMGFAMMALADAGYRSVQGIDIDRSQIDACQKRQLNVELVSDVETFLSGRPECFGLVTMLDVLEHIPVHSQIDVLRAVFAALKPQGRLIVQVPNANALLAARWRYIDFTHTTSFTEHSIRFAILNSGFASVQVPALGQPGARPSLRLWARRNRDYAKQWLVRWAWKKVLEVELGEDVSLIPLTLNLLAIADKGS